jgi:class 3 adenylate cyclase/pimeloyl-ACP methyl ester carboxylesterase
VPSVAFNLWADQATLLRSSQGFIFSAFSAIPIQGIFCHLDTQSFLRYINTIKKANSYHYPIIVRSMTNETRSLTAIMFTDIVGYTSLMEQHEAKAIRVREQHRAIVRVLVEQFKGTLIDATGDESLSTFPSALLAVDCALAIQAALRDDPDLQLRIGIHLGEVVKKDNEVIGDAVNVASRIRPLAQARGICVSEPVYQQVRNRPHICVQSLGPQSLKNVDQRVKVFALATEFPSARPQSRRRRVIAVLTATIAICVLGYSVYVSNRTKILSSIALTAPRIFGDPMEQRIGFATTSDGVRIAYATTGEGPPLVSTIGWITHLERGWTSPLYDAEGWLRWASKGHLFVRYDGRGFGLSDRNVEDFSLEARVRDLEAVVDALGLDRFALYAVSSGGPTAIAYTVRHPDRVSRLVLAGTCGKFSLDSEKRRLWDGMNSLFRTSWDSEVVRSMMSKLLVPDYDEVLQRILSEWLKISGDGPAIAGFSQVNIDIDVRDLARRIETPTLVIHGQEDPIIPISYGRDLASLIPNVQFEIMEGANHQEGAFNSPKTREVIADFLARVP